MGLQRYAVAAALLVSLTVSLTACGSEESAHDPAPTTSPASPSASSAPSSGTPSSLPTLDASDYTYRLRVLCYCPLVGAVDIAVSAGKVVSATVASGPGKGRPAPAYTHKTINDIIEIANDPRSRATTEWPPGAEVPTKVTVSPLRRTTDATISYVISEFSEE